MKRASLCVTLGLPAESRPEADAIAEEWGPAPILRGGGRRRITVAGLFGNRFYK